MVAILSKIFSKKNYKPRQNRRQSKNAKQIDSSAMRSAVELEKQEGHTSSSPSMDHESTSRTMTDGSYSTSSADAQNSRFLLERLGGRKVLSVLVDDFYKRVTSDPELMLFFEGANMNTLALHQKRFMSLAFTKIPSGMNLTRMILSHHDHLFALGLDENHFDLVAQHLVAAMVECGIDYDIIQEAIDIVAPLRAVFEAGARQS